MLTVISDGQKKMAKGNQLLSEGYQIFTAESWRAIEVN